jgi:hypothetical protein
VFDESVHPDNHRNPVVKAPEDWLIHTIGFEIGPQVLIGFLR